MIVVGIVLILLGILSGGLLFASFRRMRRTPQVSREYVTIPANDRVIRIVRPQVESRYEYRLSGVVVVGDKKPAHTFDFYLLHDMETLTLYKAGQAMPQRRYQHARRVIGWRTYMQTGPGLDFALVFVNPHPYELMIHIKLDRYVTPVLLRGKTGTALTLGAVIGVLAGVAGIILAIASTHITRGGF